MGCGQLLVKEIGGGPRGSDLSQSSVGRGGGDEGLCSLSLQASSHLDIDTSVGPSPPSAPVLIEVSSHLASHLIASLSSFPLLPSHLHDSCWAHRHSSDQVTPLLKNSIILMLFIRGKV